MFGGNGVKRGRDVATFAMIGAAGGSSKADGVGNDSLNLGVMVNRKGFVAWAEVDDFAFAPSPGATATKDFASFKPTDAK